MKTDIEIAQTAQMKPIMDIASGLGLGEDDIELYGKYKCKIKLDVLERLKDRPDGKLVMVTAITPTPAGEGKTTTTIGLGQALNKIGKKAIIALREPSVGPSFGIKGGAAGGGHSQVVPMEDINLHFTGDIHAVSTAHNLLAAILDNHIHQGNALNIDPRRVVLGRVVDLNERALRHVIVGLGGPINGFPRESFFDISVASEVMAALCLCDDLMDLKERFKRMVVAYTYDNKPVTAADLNAVGAMTLLMKEAIKPNLVQTLENTPALIHGGPFANIAHGCNSAIATRMGLKMSDILVTESGFAADLGAEKFFDLKCRLAGLKPDACVLVATVRALKSHGGVALARLNNPDLPALERGIGNLEKQIENIQIFGIPVVVALNAFPSDRPEELDFVAGRCHAHGVESVVSHAWAEGGDGAIALAHKVVELAERPSEFKLLYETDEPIKDKIWKVCTKIYGARNVVYSPAAERSLARYEAMGYGRLPVCIAKTQLSLSDDASLKGRPENFDITVRDFRLSAGAGFVVAMAGAINTMPGLGRVPAAENIDILPDGTIIGLF